jgi:tetratricopeptide (TPR) repeat protein
MSPRHARGRWWPYRASGAAIAACALTHPASAAPPRDEAPAAELSSPGASPDLGRELGAAPVAGDVVPASADADAAAQADEPGSYRPLVKAALAARAEGHPETARELMRSAHALWPSARSLRALGVLASDRGEHADATRYLEAALGSPLRPLDPALKELTLALLARESAEVARVTVVVEPSTARVELDGRLRWLTPLLLSPGEHRIATHLSGHAASEQRLVVQAGEQRQLFVRLQPAPPLREEPPAESRWWRSRWAVLGAGAALAATATLTVALLVADGPSSAYSGGNSGMVAGSRK